MFYVLLVLVAITEATLILSEFKDSKHGVVQYRNQDNLGNYRFGYSEVHAAGGTFRRESGDILGNKAGSYGLIGADGRFRIVNYVADKRGFRADIKTNEPGVDGNEDPADTNINVVDSAVPS